MTESDGAKLRNWIEGALSQVEVSYSQSIDFDDLDLDDFSQFNQAHYASLVFLSAIDHLVKIQKVHQVMPSVVVPLGFSKELDYSFGFDRVAKNDQNSLSSLYLINRDRMSHLSRVEEFKKPILFSNLRRSYSGEIYTYYRCFRSELDMNRGWEYFRAIYFEHYTSDQIA